MSAPAVLTLALWIQLHAQTPLDHTIVLVKLVTLETEIQVALLLQVNCSILFYFFNDIYYYFKVFVILSITKINSKHKNGPVTRWINDNK